MARLFPDYRGQYAGIVSPAEVKFYEACRSLSNEFHVFHSVAWISRAEGQARDGEADFLICHPDRGFLSVEVKGGRIEANYSTGRWTSIDRNGQRHSIKDPFQQAMKAKFGILSKLKEHREWDLLRIRRVGAGHAAFFPDVGDGRRLQGPNAPTEIIGDETDLNSIEAWVKRVFDFWANRDEGADVQGLGPGGIQLMARLFARVVEARPLLALDLEAEERQRLDLTARQITILDWLARHRRVAISGGAGTGKTVIATEKARRLADEGFKTLLTCYNKPLGQHLGEICSGERNLDVVHFHKLCKDIVDEASGISGRDLIADAKASYPGLDLWDQYFPIALAYALEIVDRRYDAIVVDEGQDFGEEFWLPIELMLRDGTASPLYVFLDENQNVYNRVSTFPVETAPYILNTNCRNTRQIHEVAYSFYSGNPVEASDLAGREITILDADDRDRQARKIKDFIRRLLVDERLPASSIVVLIADRQRRREYEKSLRAEALPAGAVWGDVDRRDQRTVRVETVARFKGLEAEILVLWGLDGLPDAERRETLYVGSSRAKSMLALCGGRAACERVMRGD